MAAKELLTENQLKKDRTGLTALFGKARTVMTKAMNALDAELEKDNLSTKDVLAASKLALELFQTMHEMRYQKKASRNKEKSVAELEGDDDIPEMEEKPKVGIGTGNVRFVNKFKKD